ncbi:MAG: DUF2381 family protein [Myxococcaceae bacterium]|nr:DUF2381 family protein [Myxococcaceae bacterium]
MVQPFTRAGVLALLTTVTVAAAQPQAARGRRVTVAASPHLPLPELYVAAHVATLILLDAPIDKNSVQLDSERVRLLDVGEHSLSIEPLVNPGEEERWVLRFRYADGAGPEWASLVLVSHPSAVDQRVDVVRPVRPPQPLEACQAALAEAQARCQGPRAEVWVLEDRLGGAGVQSEPIEKSEPGGGPELKGGWAYRLATGVLVVVEVQNLTGLRPWVPTEATLRPAGGAAVRVRTVAVRGGRISPGEVVQVAVEADLPSPDAVSPFTLELRDASGWSLAVRKVRIPQVDKESAER